MKMQLQDEWNPHLVQDWSRWDSKNSLFMTKLLAWPKKRLMDYVDKELTIEELAAEAQKAKEFDAKIISYQDKWHAAANILRQHGKEGWIPFLAYRIQSEVINSPADPLEGSKFGGVPDLRRYRLYGSIKDGKKTDTIPKIESVVKQLWPTCALCNKQMQFFGTVNLAQAITPIFLLKEESKIQYGPNGTLTFPWYDFKYDLQASDPFEEEFQSVFGQNFYHHLMWFSQKGWWHMFYCSHPSNPHEQSITASILLGDRFYDEKKHSIIPSDVYLQAITNFMGKNKIRARPVQVPKSSHLRFDIDCPKELWDISDILPSDFAEEHEEIFGIDHHCYNFFGEPHSWQEPARPFCTNSFRLHRMAPIVSTDIDSERLQIYACLRCIPKQNCRVYGQADISL